MNKYTSVHPNVKLKINESFTLNNRVFPYPPYSDYSYEILDSKNNIIGEGDQRMTMVEKQNPPAFLLEGGSIPVEITFQFHAVGEYRIRTSYLDAYIDIPRHVSERKVTVSDKRRMCCW